MSDTPETDAEQHEGLLRTNPIPMQVVTASFARKLERELVELREILQAVIKTGKRLESERDEARADLEFRREIYETLAESASGILKERDEARGKLAGITEAASAVVERWEQPAWKDTEPTATVIYRLRDALGREVK